MLLAKVYRVPMKHLSIPASRQCTSKLIGAGGKRRILSEAANACIKEVNRQYHDLLFYVASLILRDDRCDITDDDLVLRYVSSIYQQLPITGKQQFLQLYLGIGRYCSF